MAPFAIASGLDWLTLSVGSADAVDAIRQSLVAAAVDLAVAGENDASAYSQYTWFGEVVPLQVSLSGLRLHLADGVHVQMYHKGGRDACQITVYSASLWSHPFAEVVSEVRRLLLTLTLGLSSPLYPVRLDLFADLNGLDITSISSPDFLDQALVSRCTRFDEVYAEDTSLPDLQRTRRRRRLESLYIGSPGGAVRWNWYDKRADVAAKLHADRYLPRWSAVPGFDLEQAITRFECRVNTDFLRSFRCPALSDRMELSTIEVCLPHLWAYLTRHTRLIVPDSGSGNRSRSDTSDLWLIVVAAFSVSPAHAGCRVSVLMPDTERLEAQVSGCVVSLLALLRSSDVPPADVGPYLSLLVSRFVSSRGGLRAAVISRASRLGLSYPVAA